VFHGVNPSDYIKRLIKVAIMALVLIALTMPTSRLVEADGPWLHVNEPVDGSNLTAREVTIQGCCTAPLHTISLESAELGDHPGVNMEWGSGALVMRPQIHFNDDFSGANLDMTRWSFVRDSGVTYLQNGFLVMRSDYFSDPWESAGLIGSTSDLFPDDMDWTAEFKLKFNVVPYWAEGLSGGMTPDQIDYDGSTTAVKCAMSGVGGNEISKVFAKGSVVYNEINTRTFYTVRLEYTSTTDGCKILLDDDLLSTYKVFDVPSFFWFGSIYSTPTGRTTSQMSVDYVNLWTFNGNWLSLPYDFGHEVEVNALVKRSTSTHGSAAKVPAEVRASDDNISWSEWVPFSDVGNPSTLRCRYLQLRVNAALPGVRSEMANISIRSFDVTYRNPIVSVEARRASGEWVQATGNESWNATLDLDEDANVIEVRVSDTSGAINETRINVTVDTTPPLGTVSILTDRPYIKDLNVTLVLNATDRYGVTSMQVSNRPDMRNMRTYPFSTELPWLMEGDDGEVSVFVRFIDVHGLVSKISQASVEIDRLLPTGSLLINDGDSYTSFSTVRLDLDYYDNRGVGTIEISNQPDLADALTITQPQVTVDTWELEEGGDGPRTVHMRITDLAGNVMVVNSSIGMYIPTALGDLTINEDEAMTDMSVVQLDIKAPIEVLLGLMQLSNKADFEGAKWESVVREKTWILPTGDGLKTVHLRFEDFRGIISLPVNASITLDTTPPLLVVLLEGGAEFTTDADITATLVYDDASPPSRIWLASDERFDLVESQPFAESIPWSVYATEGEWALHVMVEDMAGNTATASASIHYATVLPLLALRLPGGTVSASENSLDVEAVVTDPYGGLEVQVAFGTNPVDEDNWWPFDETFTVQIPPGTPDGTFELRGRARNAAGLVSEIATLEVTLDRTGPIISIEKPLDGSTISQENLKVQMRYTLGDPNGLSSVSYSVDDGEWIDISPTEMMVTMEMNGYGLHKVEIRAIDSVGNPSLSSVSFIIERSEETTGIGWAVLGVLVMAVVLVVVGVLYWRYQDNQ